MSIGSYESVWERMRVAAESLASGQGGIKERLACAAVTLWTLIEEDFPKEARAEFRAIMTDMLGSGGATPGIRNSIDRLTDEQASAVAERIFNLYADCEHDRGKRDAGRGRKGPAR